MVGHFGTKNIDIVYCRITFCLRKFELSVDIGVHNILPSKTYLA